MYQSGCVRLHPCSIVVGSVHNEAINQYSILECGMCYTGVGGSPSGDVVLVS